MNRLRRSSLQLVLLVLLFFPLQAAHAQSGGQAEYIVQQGDTLTSIALRFGVSQTDLVQVNQITDPNSIKPGDQLILPGFSGVSGVLTTQTIALGESLRSISRRLQVPTAILLQLNPITSPAELYAGSSLVVPQTEDAAQLNGSAVLSDQESLLAMAAANSLNPWALVESNNIIEPTTLLPGEITFYQSDSVSKTADIGIPGIDQLGVSPLPLVQGRTFEVKVHSTGQATISGSMLGKELRFFTSADQTQVALAGVYALEKPGPYPLSLKISNPDGASYAFEQSLLVVSGNYPQDPHLTVDPSTIDPKVTGPENDKVSAATAPASPKKYWAGMWLSPAYDPKWITSWFGDRRYYNEDPTEYFHTGLDYGGGVGLPIKVCAPGVVVFTGQLIVRGNATIIDHGWGVYSAYYHQSQINVKVGDVVQAGQVIGLIGGTGRVTGPHLHWEVWVNGIQVDPRDWLDRVFP